MMDFALKQHDLALTNGDLLMCLTDADAIAQTISIRLKTFTGEWFLDQGGGLPYLDILGKKTNDLYLRSVIVNEVRNVAGVSDVKNIAITPSKDERTIVISFIVILSDQRNIAINQTIGA
jgi:hypothetical protein